VNVAALAVSAPLLASAASSSCQHTLAGPFPSAGWPTAAALMDKAALGIFKGSLGRAEYAQAVCAASLNTTLVSLVAGHSCRAHTASGQKTYRCACKSNPMLMPVPARAKPFLRFGPATATSC
jgi:hypothetical protein